ncbi:MAG: hypothetical protein JST54_21450 [Deltaproteobacteria bacterium]|nr:hypothetical protein [Deltaproteobacteria bacterium]
MTHASIKRRMDGQEGGALVEFAIVTIVLVPLILYANWFADVAHWKLKLEEATVVSTMDLTRFRVNDFSDNTPNYRALYAHATDSAAVGPGSIHQKMSGSFDSAKPTAATYASGVFARPRNLKVTCEDHVGRSQPGVVANYAMNESRQGTHVKELNIQSWVTCHAQAQIGTLGVPAHFQEMGSTSSLFKPSWTSLKLCGIGPGMHGCNGARDPGLSIMLDDWALWNPAKHEDVDLPLSLSNYNHDVDAFDTTPSDSSSGQRRNIDYFKMAKYFWRSPQENMSVQVMADAMSVAGVKELGKTDWFHISYRYATDHSYGDTEIRDGQRGAFGGPDGITRPTPHTGGPWHELYGVNSVGTAPGGLSRDTFHHREAGHYMGVKAWSEDGK